MKRIEPIYVSFRTNNIFHFYKYSCMYEICYSVYKHLHFLADAAEIIVYYV